MKCRVQRITLPAFQPLTRSVTLLRLIADQRPGDNDRGAPTSTHHVFLLNVALDKHIQINFKGIIWDWYSVRIKKPDIIV